MKKILIGILLVVASFTEAGILDAIVLQVDDVKTNTSAAATSTNVYPTKVTGKVLGIFVDVVGLGPDIDIDLRTTANGAIGVSRTIWTEDDVTADAYYDLVVRPVQTSAGAVTTNEYVPMVLYADEIELVAYDAATNLTTDVRVTIILEDE